MKSNYIERAKKFVPYVAMFIHHSGNRHDIKYEVEAFNYRHNRKVVFAHGLTRLAFITSDYVIKVDYDPEQIERFGGCENEMAVYAQAEQNGMEYLFAKITAYTYKGVTYYIMPRINGVGKYFDDAYTYMTDDEIEWCEEHGIGDLHCYNYGWRNKHVCIIDYGAIFS